MVRKAKIVGEKIIDSDEDSDQPKTEFEMEQKPSMPRSTSPMLALQPNKQQVKYCNFITDYLI